MLLRASWILVLLLIVKEVYTSANTDFRIIHEVDDSVYFISLSKADRKTAAAECKALANAHLLTIEDRDEYDELLSELEKNDVDSVWTAGGESDKTSYYWYPTSAKLWRSSARVRKSLLRGKREALCKGPYCDNPDGGKDTKDCSPIRPKCEVPICNVTLLPCKTTSRPCEILTSECTVTRPKCSTTCPPCKTHKPECSIVQKPCTVDNSKECEIIRKDCIVSEPVCKTTRPNCTTYTPPCEITTPPPCTTKAPCRPTQPCVTTQAPCSTQPPCVTTKPPCHEEPQPCTYRPKRCVTEVPDECDPSEIGSCEEITVCEPEGKTCPPPVQVCPEETEVCPPPKMCPVTTCKPTIICETPAELCQSPAIFCPQPITNCKPPVTVCETPVVTCEEPETICPEPVVTCPTPEHVCPPVQIVCPPPEVTCPAAVVHCPQPDYNCPSPIVNCPAPIVECTPTKPCEVPVVPDLPPCTTTEAPQMIERSSVSSESTSSKPKSTSKPKKIHTAQCITMSKNNSYKFDLEDCKTEHRFICEKHN